MGDTVIKDADKLSPYEVGGLTTFLGSKGLDNHVKIKGKSVGKRMDHRKYYELAKKNESTNLQKTSSLVNNNEKIMDKQIKKAAFVKLATIKLAINYIIRNRLMSKQAAPATAMGKPMQLPQQPAIGSKAYTQGLRQRIALQRPGVAWNKDTKSYDLNGMDPSVARSMMEGERARIEDAWAQLRPDEQKAYKKFYDAHINAIDNWERGQMATPNQSPVNQNPVANAGRNIGNIASSATRQGLNAARGLWNGIYNGIFNTAMNNQFNTAMNDLEPVEKDRQAKEYNEGQQLLQEADKNYYNKVAPTLVADNQLDLPGYDDDVAPSTAIAENPGMWDRTHTLEDALNGNI